MTEEGNQKLTVTTRIDIDILEYLKKQGRKAGIGYQSVINMVLRYFKDNDLIIGIIAESKPAPTKPDRKTKAKIKPCQFKTRTPKK